MSVEGQKQSRLFTEGSGVSGDLLRAWWALRRGGRGVSAHITTTGTGDDIRFLADVDFVARFTVLNSGTSTIKIGYKTATFPLIGGASQTFVDINPAASDLVYNDGGTAGTLDVI